MLITFGDDGPMINRRVRGVLFLGMASFGIITGCSSRSPSATYPTSSTKPIAPNTSEPNTIAPNTGTAAGELSAPMTTTSTTAAVGQYPSGKQTISLTVNGVERTALVVVPGDLTQPAPLVFAFHGHGGSGQYFDRRMNIEGLWPQAIVVYPNGIVGHKGITDPEGTKPGWQTLPGEKVMRIWRSTMPCWPMSRPRLELTRTGSTSWVTQMAPASSHSC